MESIVGDGEAANKRENISKYIYNIYVFRHLAYFVINPLSGAWGYSISKMEGPLLLPPLVVLVLLLILGQPIGRPKGPIGTL